MNDALHAWADGMFRASWQGGLAIALAWFICRICPRLPGFAQCWLWRLAYAKLFLALIWATPVEIPILPPLTPAPILQIVAENPVTPSVRSKLPGPLTIEQIAEVTPIPLQRNSPPEIPQSNNNPEPLNMLTFIAGLWLCGAVSVGCHHFLNWKKFAALHKKETSESSSRLYTELRILCSALGSGTVPDIRLVHDLKSPAVTGLMHPVILFPKTLIACSTDDELRLMLAHELAHLKRRDLWWNWIPLLGQILFFFHPLIWMSQREWRLAQELAADACVLRLTNASANSYGQTLLRVCERIPLSQSAGGALLSIGIVETFRTLKRRLNAIKTFKPLSARLRVLLTALLIAMGIVGLVPWNLTARAAQQPEAATNSNKGQSEPENRHSEQTEGKVSIQLPADNIAATTNDDLINARRLLQAAERLEKAQIHYDTLSARYKAGYPSMQKAYHSLESAKEEYELLLKRQSQNTIKSGLETNSTQSEVSIRIRAALDEWVTAQIQNANASKKLNEQGLSRSESSRNLIAAMVRFEDEVELIRSLIFLAENKHNQHSVSAFAESAVLSVRNSADEVIAAKMNYSELSQRYRAKHPYMIEASQRLRATVESFNRTLSHVLNSFPIAIAMANQIGGAASNQSPSPKGGAQDSAHYRRIKQLEDEVRKLRTEVEDLRNQQRTTNSGSLEMYFKNPWKSPSTLRSVNDLISYLTKQPEFTTDRTLKQELSADGLWLQFQNLPSHPILETDTAKLNAFGSWRFHTIASEIARYPAASLELHVNSAVSANPKVLAASIKQQMNKSGIKENQIFDTSENIQSVGGGTNTAFSILIRLSSKSMSAQ